jgi:hypothetical protein
MEGEDDYEEVITAKGTFCFDPEGGLIVFTAGIFLDFHRMGKPRDIAACHPGRFFNNQFPDRLITLVH